MPELVVRVVLSDGLVHAGLARLRTTFCEQERRWVPAPSHPTENAGDLCAPDAQLTCRKCKTEIEGGRS